MFGSGIDAIGLRRFVVVGRGDARRPDGAAKGGRMPQNGEAVEEGGHVFIGKVETVVGGQTVGT